MDWLLGLREGGAEDHSQDAANRMLHFRAHAVKAYLPSGLGSRTSWGSVRGI